MNIYIGNFSYEITGENLKEVFEAFGYVQSAKIIRDKFTGHSKGFGFVEMPNKTEAQAAIDGIKQIHGRHVSINEARPQFKIDFGSTSPRRPRRHDPRRRERRY